MEVKDIKTEENKMVLHKYQVECQQCHKIIPFLNPNFCCYCGEKISDKSKEKASTMTEQEYQCRQRSW